MNIIKKSLSLENKMFISCSAILLLAVIIIVSVFVAYTENKITEIYYENSKNILEMEGGKLNIRLDSIIQQVFAMYLSAPFQDIIDNYLKKSTTDTSVRYLTAFTSMFIELKSSDSLIDSIFVNTKKGNFFDLSMPANYEIDFSKTEIYQTLQKNSDEFLIWGKPSNNEFYYDKDIVIPIIFRFNESFDNEIIMVISLDCEKLQSNFKNNTFIVNDLGNIIAADNIQYVENLLKNDVIHNALAEHGNGFIKHEDVFLSYTDSIAPSPWKLASFSFQDELRSILSYIKSCVALIILISLAFCILYLLLSHKITKPLYLLKKGLETAIEKDFNVYIDYKYNDEVGNLVKSFNYMIGEIKKLVTDLKEKEESIRIEQQLKRKAELKALQAQINPHFLYNTLDSINWKAVDIQAEDISKMTTALASLFRIGLSKGNEIISLHDEIKHVSSYLMIQKMRYDEKFDYTISLPKSLEGYYSVKLILQPLVENSIYHGIKESDSKGIIEITSVIYDNSIQLVVKDNGIGFKPDKLKTVNIMLNGDITARGEGYGIFNVNERVKLYFGNEYGLKFSQIIEGGENKTLAVITIPKITLIEVENYV